MGTVVKHFSDWPTFPQLYIQGHLVGGADVVNELYSNGQLLTLLQNSQATNTSPVQTPSLQYFDGKGDVGLIDDPARHVASMISKALNAAFTVQNLIIVDESRDHEGHIAKSRHSGVGESHFKVELVSPDFVDLLPVKTQQKVYSALAEVMPHIHALSLTTKTPEEMQLKPVLDAV